MNENISWWKVFNYLNIRRIFHYPKYFARTWPGLRRDSITTASQAPPPLTRPHLYTLTPTPSRSVNTQLWLVESRRCWPLIGCHLHIKTLLRHSLCCRLDISCSNPCQFPPFSQAVPAPPPVVIQVEIFQPTKIFQSFPGGPIVPSGQLSPKLARRGYSSPYSDNVIRTSAPPVHTSSTPMSFTRYEDTAIRESEWIILFSGLWKWLTVWRAGLEERRWSWETTEIVSTTWTMKYR